MEDDSEDDIWLEDIDYSDDEYDDEDFLDEEEEYDMTMRVQQFPSCCGANMIIGFWGTERTTKPKVEYILSTRNRNAMHILTLAPSQHEQHAGWLKEMGFKEVASGANGNSGNTNSCFIITRKKAGDHIVKKFNPAFPSPLSAAAENFAKRKPADQCDILEISTELNDGMFTEYALTPEAREIWDERRKSGIYTFRGVS